MTKKIVVVLVLFAFAYGLIWFFFTGDDTISADELSFEENSEGNITITDIHVEKEALILPSTIDGNTVTKIDIPHNNTAIDEVTTLIRLPDSVESIESFAFYHFKELQRIEIDESNAYYRSKDGILYTHDMTTLVAYPRNKEGFTFTIMKSVETIESYAFSNQRRITTLDFEEDSALKTISYRSFANMVELRNLSLPEGLTTIGDTAFYGMNVPSLEIPGSVEVIGPYAFFAPFSSGIRDLQLNEGLIEIGSNAFLRNRIEEIAFPTTLRYIGDGAFEQNDLTELHLNSGLEEIGESAFEDNNIRTLTFDDEMTLNVLQEAVFLQNQIQELALPASVDTIFHEAFADNHDMVLMLNGDHALNVEFMGPSYLEYFEPFSETISIVVEDEYYDDYLEHSVFGEYYSDSIIRKSEWEE